MSRAGKRFCAALALTTAMSALPAHAFAQIVDGQDAVDDNAADQEAEAADIVVTGSRLVGTAETFAGSVTVLDAEDIAEQRVFTNDPIQILAATTPGLTPASPGSASNFDITLRGRRPAIFIDGVPTTVPLRDGARDVRTLAPSAIGGIEVIRGSTSIYGIGGAGGTINYITKTPTREGTEFYTNVGVGLSLIHPKDSFVNNFEQAVNLRKGGLGIVASGLVERYTSLFDADGDRLPPNPATQGGIADTVSYNLFGKAVFDIDDTQSIRAVGNVFSLEQDTNYRAGNGVFGSIKTPSLFGANPIEQPTYSENDLAYVQYINEELLSSRISLQAYYGRKADRYRLQAPGVFGPNGDQTEIFSKKYGIRLDGATNFDLFEKTTLQWGLDYGIDKTFSTLVLSGKLLVPHIKQTTLAPFAQAEVELTDWLTVSGGARHEDFKLDVEDFTTVFITAAQPGGLFVEGGTLNYSKTVFNVGAVVDLFDSVSVFGAFSQGYSVADIGRVFLFATIPSVETFKPEAQVIDSYEVGIRGRVGPVRGSLAGYITKSDLGSTFNAVTFEILRSKERVWGIEATLDATISPALLVGGTFSYQDGDRDSNNDGTLDRPLDTTRIGPTKVTGFVEVTPGNDLSLRVQALYADKQDRFPGEPPRFGTAPINSYLIVDAAASMPLATGVLSIGVSNLLNHDYFLPGAIRNALPTTYVKGPGTMAQISYRVTY